MEILKTLCKVKQIEGIKYINETEKTLEWVFGQIVKGGILTKFDSFFRLETKEETFYVEGENVSKLPHLSYK